MASRVKDLVDVTGFAAGPADREGSAPSVLSTFLLTYDLGDALQRIVERVTSDDGSSVRNCLIVGNSGCGKSMLLEVASSLLETPSADDLQSRLAAIRSTLDSQQTLVIRVNPGEMTERLAPAIESALRERFDREGLPCRAESRDGGPSASLDVVSEAAAALPARHRILFALDDLDAWLRVTTRFAHENLRTLARLGEMSQSLPVATCAVAGARILRDDSSAQSGDGWIASLVDTFQIEYVPSHAVRTATANRVLRKNARQRHEILDVLAELRLHLPELAYTDDEFVEMYPLEVSTWTIGSHLHRWIENFSFPEFAARAAESVRGRPAPSLFALNDMFAMYEARLREVASLAPLFGVYDHLVAEALPRLAAGHRLWGRLALQSLMMHSIAGMSVDVVTLTNSVLLYSLHEGDSSYALMSAVVKQLEALGRGQLVGSGDASARRYVLVTGEREALKATVADAAEAAPDDEDELLWALLGFGTELFADWPFGPLSRDAHQRDLWEIEQALTRVVITMRAFAGRAVAPGAPPEARPRLVILAPGRSWSEARAEVERAPNSAVWIGGASLRAERAVLKQWLALERMAETSLTSRATDIDRLRAELTEQLAEIFKRVYVDGGTLVNADRSEAMGALVSESRAENLIVRLMPTAARAAAASASSGGEDPQRVTMEIVPNADSIWLANLTAERPENVEALAISYDPEQWLKRLESWYAKGIERDAGVPARLQSGEAATIPRVAEALEAKRQFGAVLYDVRRALMAGTVRRLGRSLGRVFETPEQMWEARERLDWLERFGAWFPTLEHAERYLREAEPSDDPLAEENRRALLASIADPSRFADEMERVAFGYAFESFRAAYAEAYAAKHDRTVSAAVVDRLCDGIIGSASWRALENLSALSVGKQSYLIEAINLISVLRDAQCEADAAAALLDRPVCVCGFRPVDASRINAMAVSAGEFVQTGVEYHRRLLRDRRAEIQEKLKSRKSAFGMETIRSIAELTKTGPLPEIDERTVEALNALFGEAEPE